MTLVARVGGALVAVATALALLCAPAVGAPAITDFPVLTSDRGPLGMTAGPDGNVWFAESAGAGGIGRITPSHSITEFTAGLSGPVEEITSGPDGNLWFTEAKNERIGRITPTGTITEFPLPKGSQPVGITSGSSDGNLWFAVPSGAGAIGRITSTGEITLFSIGLTANAKPTGIAAGPDGNLWFTENANPGRIGRITTTGTITEYSGGLTSGSQPHGIAAGSDGNLWFTEGADPGRIGRITTQGVITQYSTGLTSNSQPQAIAAADDGSLYFTEFKDPGRIGRITTSGSISQLPTPTEKSQPGGIAAGPDGNIWFSELGNHGQIGSLTVAPSAGAAAASAITEQTAELTAPVGPNSQPTTVYFEYGTTTGYGVRTAPSSAGSGSSQSSQSAHVGELAPGTLYHARVVAENPSGITYGADQTFATTSPPSAVTQPATEVTLTTVSLHAGVNPQAQPTTYHFDWGSTTSYGSHVPAIDAGVGSDGSSHALEQGLSGLTPDATYHYRVVASNCGGCAEGTTYGGDEVFTTAPAPSAQTRAASEVTRTSANVTGIVGPHGAATSYHFDWGVTSAYESQTPASGASAGSDNAEHTLTQSLQNLRPGTTYHYRIVATNCSGCLAGTSYGADMTLATESLPFELSAAPATLLGSAAPAPPAPAAALPSLGRTALVHLISGRVLVREPGSTATQPLGMSAADIPMGSTIDATRGVIALATATDARGHTQSATLWAGVFVIRQASAAPGLTSFVLAAPLACPRAHHAGTKAATASVHARSRGLWARDNHGHFSTRGQNSVATVRGTLWETLDRCDGTLTIVKRGVVAVRDLRRQRTIIVRTGRRYLARS